jgi:mRNA interferase RelE/StbE
VPPKDRGRIVARIQTLADEPRPVGAEKLSGQERYRVPGLPDPYDIEHEIPQIMVVKIGHRRDVYGPDAA